MDENEKTLKGMPPPLVALQYYRGSDLYMCAAGSAVPKSQILHSRLLLPYL